MQAQGKKELRGLQNHATHVVMKAKGKRQLTKQCLYNCAAHALMQFKADTTSQHEIHRSMLAPLMSVQTMGKKQLTIKGLHDTVNLMQAMSKIHG